MKVKKLVGWLAAQISFAVVALWTYWGINEAFHEGWYYESVIQNIFMTLVQYLSIPIILLSATIIAIYYQRIGAGIFVALGVAAFFFFDSPAGRFLIMLPVLMLAVGFFFGKLKKKKMLSIVFISIFLLIIIAIGLPQLIRVHNRTNDMDFGMRIVEGNDVTLAWAPQGSGFPPNGTNWQSAAMTCSLLDVDGTFTGNFTNLWRLPSRDELVRSLTRHDENAGGRMVDGKPVYDIKPDKETPLWNPNSRVIYYWTNESDFDKAYLVAYNGYVLKRTMSSGPAYQGFRCVKVVSAR